MKKTLCLSLLTVLVLLGCGESPNLPPKADIVLIIDTTISMGEEINGVKTSLVTFLDGIADSSIDIQVAGYAYADETVEYKDLTSDYGDGTEFKNWIDGLSAGYMDQSGGDWPENGLDPIAEAMTDLTWRNGSRRFFIVITDDSFHIQDGDDLFTTWTVETLYTSVLQPEDAVVHAVGKAKTQYASDHLYYNKDHEKYLSEMTGGQWVEIPADGNIDLTTTGILDAIVAVF